VDYRFEAYREDDKRMSVDTHAMLFDVTLTHWLSIKGEAVYDAVSGATPYGAPPPSQIKNWFSFPGFTVEGNTNSTKVPLLTMRDWRHSVDIEPTFSYGSQRLTPQFSHSIEGDYESLQGSLGYSIDLNEKNTTLNAGASFSADRNFAKTLSHVEHKYSTDLLLGINQLLGPKTALTVDFTYGNAHGFLNDPYKGVLFENEAQGSALTPSTEFEQRPHTRDKYIGYVALTQYVDPLNASVEGSYRIYDDTFGIIAHTVGLAWYQKVGKYVVIAPIARYYRQTAADFYYTQLPDFNNAPAFYSADYRLSEFESLTLGVGVTVKPTKWLQFDAAYKRYIMNGLDSITSQSAYPSANIFTIGARIWF